MKLIIFYHVSLNQEVKLIKERLRYEKLAINDEINKCVLQKQIKISM